ncbi:interferon gamma receptor 1-like [Mugil cephalus]|uniref:interferon gamma receptor 1-like n=1 Tax=Mugil cephalus TaxID=48193 RepID=UPI001FB83E72|nr:interferon gamma receptor 1-like [Mugil cephalus]
MPLPDGSFAALLLLVTGVSAVSGSVLPPTNVTLSCQDFKVTASWAHSRPQASFKVKLNSNIREGLHGNQTREHHYDLSHIFWAQNSCFMDICFVTVTAVEGDEESDGVDSNTLSFDDLETSLKRCRLGFPRVDVDAHDSGATVMFSHPVRYYKELKDKKLPKFKFNVSIDTEDQTQKRQFDATCNDEEDICKLDVTFPEGSKKCVKLRGWLKDRLGVGEIVFRETDRICAPLLTEIQKIILLVVLLLIFVLALAAIVAYFCFTSASSGSDMPDSLKFECTGQVIDVKQPLIPNPEPSEYLKVSVEKRNSKEPELTESISSCRENPEEDRAYGTDSSAGSLENDEAEGSGWEDHYDRRHQPLELDMGDGDMIEGYRG